MTISAVPWRARRPARAGAAVGSGEQPCAQPDVAQPSSAQPSSQSDAAGTAGLLARRQRRVRIEQAAAVNDRFLDLIVLLSVLMFLALATGVGMLVLQSALR